MTADASEARKMTSLFTIDQSHKNLYTAFLKKRVAPGFEKELKQLFNEITELSGKVPSLEDYEKLCELVEEWKAAGPALVGLGIKIDIDEILLTAPDKILQTDPDQPIWTENSLEFWLRQKSDQLNKERALAWYLPVSMNEVVRAFEDNLSAEAAERIRDSNWGQAELYLAADILAGGPDLARSLSPESFWRLEGSNGQIWLQDIKTLRAYLNWKDRGGGWGEEEAKRDYLRVCQDLIDNPDRPSLINPYRKAPQAAFDPVQKYIQAGILDQAGSVEFGKDKARRWVQVKAQRLMDTGYAEHIGQGEQAAKKQMKMFYENITRAVLGLDEESTLSVLAGLGLHPMHQVNDVIVNCFEMAVAVYFLEASITKRLLGECRQAEMPGMTAMAAAASGR